jgi:hypothetical protein
MDRAEYEASVCQRLHQAKHVLFREVWFADGSAPQSSRCHDNVDRWVKENSRTTVLRGWVTNAEFSLTAHSVVRGADGGLFDITPLESKDPRIRAAMCFIPHLGDEQSFFSLKALGININCPQTLKEGRYEHQTDRRSQERNQG